MTSYINTIIKIYVALECRNTGNTKFIGAEGSNAEATMTSLISYPFGDILSNGFKVRNTSTIDNQGTYIFAAFAESPFQTANAK